ncbi:hypothetical protein OROGR_015708 [Orobanche gracilis]
MSYHSRRILTPGASRKRKEMEALQSSTSSKTFIPPTSVNRSVSFTSHGTTSSSKGAEQQPMPSNRLLAGYMAYEFLTKGTLLRQSFDPARAEAKRNKLCQPSEAEPSGKSKPTPPSYSEVASLLKTAGVHIPGIVNPTQLSRWIEM